MADAVQFPWRKATSAEWTAQDPVLPAGHLGWATDGADADHRFKVGDGSTAWSGLAWSTDFTGSTGSTGAPGADGSVWRNGSGAPSNGTGVNGDYYLDTANGDVYKRASGTYSIVGNIKGATGATGAAGADGHSVLNGSGVPSGGTGVDGDFYLDTTAHAIYGPKAAGVWGSSTSLIGPTGSTGTTGADGRNAGLKYVYLTDTASSDPGSGKIKFSSATLSAATDLRISETDSDSLGLAAWLATWDDSTSTIKGYVYMRKDTDPTVFAVFSLSGALTDNGSWDNITVANVVSAGSFANNDVVKISFTARGDAGASGGRGSGVATGAGYGGTSTTSLAIGTGSKAFTTQAGLAYVVGSRIRAASASGPTNYMEGICTAYSSTTLTITSDAIGGSGTKTDWNLSIAGNVGATGTGGVAQYG